VVRASRWADDVEGEEGDGVCGVACRSCRDARFASRSFAAVRDLLLLLQSAKSHGGFVADDGGLAGVAEAEEEIADAWWAGFSEA